MRGERKTSYWNIPTRVGKTCQWSFLTFKRPEHPHACGENYLFHQLYFRVLGTSPRVWGKRRTPRPASPCSRNIPTRVGKTLGFAKMDFCPKEHPHACGENVRAGIAFSAGSGTSPRVWGKLTNQAQAANRTRNIPTRVGKTAESLKKKNPVLGTSPRVWGKRRRGARGLLYCRNIPTRVGKTRSGEIFCDGSAEHPHACGENPGPCRCTECPVGTSPRVWGKLSPLMVPVPIPRNIPTRVGKTAASRAAASCSSEHPHACGENCKA